MKIIPLPRTGWLPMLATSDAKGAFSFHERVPVGTYVLTTTVEPRMSEKLPSEAKQPEPDWIDVVVEEVQEEVVVELQVRDR